MSSISTLQEEFVPIKSRIWVSAGDAACALLNNFVTGVALTYFFTSWRGLKPSLASIVWILFGIWNAINDPLFGYISDRTKSSLGRRIPYIRYGAPLFGIAFIACWINWPGSQSNQTAMFIQMTLLLFLFDLLYTAIATSLYVMPFEMAISNKARSDIFLWKMGLAVFPMAVPLVLFGFIKPGPGQSATLFQIIMTGLGILMGAIIFFSTFFYDEKSYHQEEEQPPFLVALKECFTNKSFVIFEIFSFTMIYVQTALMLGLGYYLDEIGLPAIPLYSALAAGILIGIVFFVKQRDKWGVKKSVRFMTLIFSIGCFIIIITGTLLIPAFIGFFCFGVGFAGGMYLTPMMNGDVVDMDEHRTGLRREGMYAGVNSFITKPAISLANSIFLWFLALKGYEFDAIKGSQSASAETGILLGWVLVPGILLFLSFISLHWYPLEGEMWQGIKEKLAAAHKQKEKDYLEAHGYKLVE